MQSEARAIQITQAKTGASVLAVNIVDCATGKGLPARVRVMNANGEWADGAGRGVYIDGRFFVDGGFEIDLPPGRTTISVQCGPEYAPLTFAHDAILGQRAVIAVSMYRWVDTASLGWYCGDAHVHTQHDPDGEVMTDVAYTILQARAQGLHFISNAAKLPGADQPRRRRADGFLWADADELAYNPYTGHFTTPGIASPLPNLSAILGQPLPTGPLAEEVHRLGGALVYTHPLSPPHQLHWMGATLALSDAVTGRCADAIDVDSPPSEALWYAILNLGNRVAVSASTDSTLERKSSPAPGDRRVYVHAERLDARAIGQAIRKGKTFASSGGPLVLFMSVDGADPGTSFPSDGSGRRLHIEAQSLNALKSVTLIRRGVVVQDFGSTTEGGIHSFDALIFERSKAWYVARGEDHDGSWVVTSPFYWTTTEEGAERTGWALMLEIANCTRMVQLRRTFYAHVVATVSPLERIRAVELLRDGQLYHCWLSDEGSAYVGSLPVTGSEGEYTDGHVWHPSSAPHHFQADAAVEQSGWYSVRLTTADGTVRDSDAVRYDADNPESTVTCVAHLGGGGTLLTRHGYGEDMPLSEISVPFDGDHWWYPQRMYWCLTAEFDGNTGEWSGGDFEREHARFRRT